MTAATITAMSAAEAIGVNRPRASRAPPPNSMSPAARACRRPGLRPIWSKKPAVPARPWPPKIPKSFWAPWPTNRSPTTRRRTRSARSMRRRYPRETSPTLTANPHGRTVAGDPPEGADDDGFSQGHAQHAEDGQGHDAPRASRRHGRLPRDEGPGRDRRGGHGRHAGPERDQPAPHGDRPPGHRDGHRHPRHRTDRQREPPGR